MIALRISKECLLTYNNLDMNIEEAIKAMQSGAKLTHKYLPAMGTQYLYIIDGEYVDSKGYILNKVDVEARLKANIFKIGWQKVN